MTLRSNSVKRSSRRRARRVSAGMNEDVLATDSGVFEAWSRRLEWHFNTHTRAHTKYKETQNAHKGIFAKHNFCDLAVIHDARFRRA